MNYIGSKASLLKFIDESIKSVVHVPIHSFCDLFAGTGVVGSWFKKNGVNVVANDLQYYAYVLNRHYIGNNIPLEFKAFSNKNPFEILQNLPPFEGFIFQNYAPSGTKNTEFERCYFSDENALLCDAIRTKIQEWKIQNIVTEDEYFFLLASLLEAIDKVANTAAVYGAFLKKIKKSACQKMILKPLPIISSVWKNKVYNQDANELVKTIKTDVLYLDPPYNSRQYAANYHVLETIAKYDDPVIRGKTGLRCDLLGKSQYCSKRFVKKAFADLIQRVDAKYIFLSYNNEGLLDLEDIQQEFEKKGSYSCFHQPYSRFKADRKRAYKALKTTEYLHACICKKNN